MAFGGAAVVGQASRNIHEITGVTLAANVGGYDNTGVAADGGLITSDLTTTPAGAVTLPTSFGPGEGKWTAADVAAVEVSFDDSAVTANARAAIGEISLVGGNLQVGIHSVEAGALAALRIRIRAEHSSQR